MFRIVKMIAILSFILIVASLGSRNEMLVSAKVCDEKACALTTNYLTRVMNPNVSPCDDFAEFVCGNGLKIAEQTGKGLPSKFDLSQALLTQEVSELLFKTRTNLLNMTPNRLRLGNFFKSCTDRKMINQRGARPLVEVLEKIGGSPLFGSEMGWTSEEDFDWVELMLKARKLGLDHDILFTISPSIDKSDFKTPILRIDLPVNQINFVMVAQGKQELLIYYSKLTAILNRLNPVESVIGRVWDLYKFRHSLYDVELNPDFQNAEPMTLKQLKTLTRNIDWSRLLNELLGKTIEDSAKVIVPHVNYFVNLDKLLRDSNPALVADHMVISMIESNVNHLGDDMSLIPDDINPDLLCIKNAMENLDLAISVEFVRETISPRVQSRAKEMVKLIKQELRSSIGNSTWISQETKEFALEKLDAVREFVGYPNEFLNDTFVEEYYEGLGSLSPDQYFENILRLRKFNYDFLYNIYEIDPRNMIWSIHAKSIVNAFYVPQFNSIHLLAPMVQFPFFAESGQGYLNFGSLGSIVGHELNHGFDPHGATFDKNGDKKFWWDNETKDEFLRRAECFVRQYDNLPIPNVKSITLDGKKTLGENIADNGGYLVAYRAYKKWLAQNGAEPKLVGLPFNEDQLFWISAASNWCIHHEAKEAKILALIDVHSPPKYRINIPFSNLPEFSRAFNCPLGSPMNPKKKCSFF